jgi:DNA invertase Pin-like site-specific DNA recombinase
MDNEKEVEIVQMHAAGMKAPAIAVELEISVSAVRTVLRKTIKAVTRPALDEDAIIQTYTDGVPAGEILHVFSITYATLYRVLAAHDIKTRAAVNAPGRSKQLEAAVKLYEAGAPLWSILQETGISQPVLHNELHRLGVSLRRPRVL